MKKIMYEPGDVLTRRYSDNGRNADLSGKCIEFSQDAIALVLTKVNDDYFSQSSLLYIISHEASFFTIYDDPSYFWMNDKEK